VRKFIALIILVVLMGWVAAYTAPTNTLSSTNAGDRNERQIVPAAGISVSGTKIRVTVQGASGGNATLDGCSIVERDEDDVGTETPTRITFNTGSSSVTLSGDTPVVSDEIEFTIDETKDYLVHFWWGLDDGWTFKYATSGGGGDYSNYGPTDYTLTIDPNLGSPTADRNICLVKIEVEEAGGYTLTCDSGSYAITGTAMSPLHDKILGIEAGSYAITGTAASLLKDSELTLDSGTYTLTGTASGLIHNKKLVLGAGTYTITGTAATLLHNKVLTIGAGSYIITGKDVTLTYTPAGGVIIYGEGLHMSMHPFQH
jgi:hypothetical protein